MSGIVKLHGTSGSGKSTVARSLMKRSSSVTPLGSFRKPEGYICTLTELKQPLYILGPYSAVCGGMDSINDASVHIILLQKYAALGHVFYEGLLASEYYGRIGSASLEYGDRHLFAFLDTPIEVCIERVKNRRLVAGNSKPLNETNTRGRIKKIERLKYKLDHVYHRKTAWIPYQDPLPRIMEHYRAYDKSGVSRDVELLDRGTPQDSQQEGLRGSETMD